MYWMLRKMPTRDNDARIHGQPETIEKLGLNFGKGLEVPGKFKEIVITRKKSHPGNLTDNLLAYGATGFVFNKKIRNILKKLNVNNIDYYKAVLDDEITGESTRDYQIANIIGVVKCIDMEKSEFRLDVNNRIESIKKLVLDQDELWNTDLPIFRIAEYFPIVLVHNILKEAFEKEGVTGLGYMKPEMLVL